MVGGGQRGGMLQLPYVQLWAAGLAAPRGAERAADSPQAPGPLSLPCHEPCDWVQWPTQAGPLPWEGQAVPQEENNGSDPHE